MPSLQIDMPTTFQRRECRFHPLATNRSGATTLAEFVGSESEHIVLPSAKWWSGRAKARARPSSFVGNLRYSLSYRDLEEMHRMMISSSKCRPRNSADRFFRIRFKLPDQHR